ncbi:hypothetical protein [Paraburkholderia caribensis]|uniref:hypothetical protein n=1 Tax=Paraburkholderia caribensis TaxID=75105 RepID=UPI001D089CA0|nr:hypothetical protein [Paraburkholderia caribensis]
MSILLKRLEALEAAKAAAKAQVRPIESAAERAELLHSYIWRLCTADSRVHRLRFAHDYDAVMSGDGHWPFLPGGHGAARRLRVDALWPIYDATQNEMIGLLMSMAARLSPPVEGGEVPFFAEEGDIEPFVRFWFAPAEGADLL